MPARTYVYRGVAAKYDGLSRFTSSSQSAAAWTTTFRDEFDRTELGSKWQDRVSDADSRECSKVGDSRARKVADGALHLSVMLDPAKKDQTCLSSDGRFKYYLNGQVNAPGFAQTYGTFAARIKFAERRGQHGSFWMQPVNRRYIEGDPVASGAEIDTVEFFGKGYEQGGLASFLYNYGVDGGKKKIRGMAPSATRMLPEGDNWWKSYHVFSVEWTKSQYIFRVDGREHFRTKAGVSGIDEYLILSMLSSDWELKQAKNLGIQPGGTMKVDTRLEVRPARTLE